MKRWWIVLVVYNTIEPTTNPSSFTLISAQPVPNVSCTLHSYVRVTNSNKSDGEMERSQRSGLSIEIRPMLDGQERNAQIK